MAHVLERPRGFRALESSAVAAALVAASHFGGEIVWNHGPTSLTPLPYHGPRPIETMGVVFPGMGILDGEEMAHQMNDATPVNQPWAYFAYDNKKGVSVEDMAQKLLDLKKSSGIQALDIYAPSMGLILGLQAARIADIPIRVLLANSSPTQVDDTYKGKLGDKVLSALPYDFGLAGRLAGTLIADSVHRGIRNTPDNIRHAWNETLHGASTKLIRSEVKVLGSADLELDLEGLSRIIIPGFTRAAYAMPPIENDKVVKVDQAYQRLSAIFAKLGVTLDLIEMPEGGHADTINATKYGKSWLEKAYSSTETVVFSRAAS